MLMLLQTDSALLRKGESRKHVESRPCGSAVSNRSKTSHVNIYYVHLSFSIFSDSTSFKKFTGTYKCPFPALVIRNSGTDEDLA
jgi:hypothetical protein